MGIVSEFKEFAFKGNMIDMAVGIIIGAAFSTVVKSLVDDVIMPPIGLATGGIDFSELKVPVREAVPATTDAAGTATPAVEGVYIHYGSFINNLLTFLIVAFAVFVLIKSINTAKKRFEEEQIAEPAKAPPDVQLLTEIRDLLKAKG